MQIFWLDVPLHFDGLLQSNGISRQVLHIRCAGEHAPDTRVPTAWGRVNGSAIQAATVPL